ncbi:MAG: MoaD/ThiS family protein [Mycolicibacterium sp.]|uniref:MoaD/ThiS family protein n=1 Tax=Mycolicibacterium sp. TaxID=2320850 RepID=UPI003D12C140
MHPHVNITVRYFAAARAAAGVDSETIELPTGATLVDLASLLASRDAGLSAVLARCSYLCDGVAVRHREIALRDTQTIDVLPPFAGG